MPDPTPGEDVGEFGAAHSLDDIRDAAQHAEAEASAALTDAFTHAPSGVTRYDFDGDGVLEPERDGEWVRFSDVRKALVNTKAAHDDLLNERDDLRRKLRDVSEPIDTLWVWSGDGTDDLDSMSEGMVVLITAGDLRAALAEKDALLRELEWNGGPCGGFCPMCASSKWAGHLDDCDLRAALPAEDAE